MTKTDEVFLKKIRHFWNRAGEFLGAAGVAGLSNKL
jgi:hypothetical protein